MGGPPPPPRGKKGVPSGAVMARQGDFRDDYEQVHSGAGYNVPKRRGPPEQALEDDYSPLGSPKPLPRRKNIMAETPETTIGAHVNMKGELSFEKLLRIDGSFDGKLISTGDLIVGPSGLLKGNIADMGEVIIEGRVVGNLACERILLKGQAQVHGDVTCKVLQLDPGVCISGKLNVHPDAPDKLRIPGGESADDTPEDTSKTKKLSVARRPSKSDKEDKKHEDKERDKEKDHEKEKDKDKDKKDDKRKDKDKKDDGSVSSKTKKKSVKP
ncbi:unnamed protein product [Chrysoparadoxa australica]